MGAGHLSGTWATAASATATTASATTSTIERRRSGSVLSVWIAFGRYNLRIVNEMLC